MLVNTGSVPLASAIYDRLKANGILVRYWGRRAPCRHPTLSLIPPFVRRDALALRSSFGRVRLVVCPASLSRPELASKLRVTVGAKESNEKFMALVRQCLDELPEAKAK